MQNQQKKPNEIDIQLGNNLKSIREKEGISQFDLADMLNLSTTQIQKYEKGINRISVSRLIQIAQALNVEIEIFFDSIY